MKKLILFMHTSLDGFACGPNGELDWVNIDDEMFEFVENKLSAECDTALYGRHTYELMESYWPTAADQPNATKHDIQHAKWYKNANKIVLSKTMTEKKDDRLTIISDNLTDKIKKEKEKPGRDIYIFGSPTASHSLMKHDLIDGYWFFINPVLLSEGKPVFQNIQGSNKLKMTSTKIFSSGVICSAYEK